MIAAVPKNALKPLLAPGADDAGRAQQRAEARSNLFVAALLYGDGTAAPVRIRNLSRRGALIEAPSAPPEGVPVRLVRGSHSANGRIAWRRDNRAGVQFDADIAVSDWLPGGNRQNGQQRVDEMVHACRTGVLGPVNAEAPSAGSQSEAARQLLESSETLRAAAEELAGDPVVAAAHMSALQTIDMLGHDLRTLAATLLLKDGR